MNVLVFVLAAFTVTIRPAEPKIGQWITVEFPAAVALDPSPDYEIVSRQGRQVVVRTFNPKPFVMSGTSGGVRFAKVTVPVTPVLAPNDSLTPAPLAPPVVTPYPRGPFIAITVAGLAVLSTWLAVWRSAHRMTAPVTIGPVRSPEQRFREAVLALRGNGEHPRRWAALADETRIFLAATRHLGNELTTTELVPRLAERDVVAADILRFGDVEKFAPGGRPEAEFEAVADQALILAQERVPDGESVPSTRT
jgi:hypothetical protein